MDFSKASELEVENGGINLPLMLYMLWSDGLDE